MSIALFGFVAILLFAAATYLAIEESNSWLWVELLGLLFVGFGFYRWTESMI